MNDKLRLKVALKSAAKVDEILSTIRPVSEGYLPPTAQLCSVGFAADDTEECLMHERIGQFEELAEHIEIYLHMMSKLDWEVQA
tara:strand:+ start:41 stop:292 length:252 start_codon:yes stop_codon:yes gene_type:complete